jgi:hypothetical protein
VVEGKKVIIYLPSLLSEDAKRLGVNIENIVASYLKASQRIYSLSLECGSSQLPEQSH